MSYTYREREREWDDYSRPSESRNSYTIKRYVVAPEEEREVFRRREESSTDERELVIRPKKEWEETDYETRRFERDYRSERDYERQTIIIQEARGPVYISPRDEAEYQVVQRSEAVDREPRDVEYHYQKRVREVEDDRDSASQATSRRERDREYSSDDSMVYIRKETREFDEGSHHRRHLEGALVGIGAAELLRHHSKGQGEEVSSGWRRVGRDIGAGALGAVAAETLRRAQSHHRSKSQHRSEFFEHEHEHDHGSHRRHRHRSRRRSRSRSSSHSRMKQLAGLGLGAAALAGAVALARKKSNDARERERRSRSRHRRGSQSSSEDDKRSISHRNKRMAEAGLAGAAAAGLIDRARSKSRSRKGERSRSHSRLRKALPVLAAGLGSATLAGLYERNKEKKAEAEIDEARRPRSRSRPRSQSRPRSLNYPNSFPDSTAGLIEYGHEPVYGTSPHDTSRSFRSRSQGDRYSSDGSERAAHRRRRRRKEHRSRSRSLELAEAGLATASGYAVGEYGEAREGDIGNGSRRVHDSDRGFDRYEETYSSRFPPPPAPAPRPANSYPYNSQAPPPSGPAPLNPMATHNSTDSHPYLLSTIPTPQHYGYPSSQGPPPADGYGRRNIRGEENVSAPYSDEHHRPDGLKGLPIQPPLRPRAARLSHLSQNPRPRSFSQPPAAASRMVISDPSQDTPGPELGQPSTHNLDPGYESDDSDSTVDGIRPSLRLDYNPRYRRALWTRNSASFSPSATSRSKPYLSTSHNDLNPSTINPAPGSDSESTIDLPPRFDAQGQRLSGSQESFIDPVEHFLSEIPGAFLDGPHRWLRREFYL